MNSLKSSHARHDAEWQSTTMLTCLCGCTWCLSCCCSQATTPFTRLYILPPLLFLGSMAMPAMDLGYNTGILHVFTRAIGTYPAAHPITSCIPRCAKASILAS